MSQNINQFSQSANQGSMDLRFNPAVMSVQVDVSSAGGLVAGQPVKMVDSVGGVPKVVECAADADDVYGIIVYDIKSKVFNAGDRCEIAAMRDNVIYLTASAAIARNAKVAIVSGSPGQVQTAVAASGKMIIGRALDKATGAGQLIRVTLDLPGVPA